MNKNKWQSVLEIPSTSHQSIQAIAACGDGGMLIFDGDDIKNTYPTTSWLWKGKWMRQNTKGPPPRVGHAMVWDPTQRAVVLFGGFDRTHFLNDTWIWRNEKWVQQP